MGNKNWPHAPEALLRGRLVYNVKFYGDQLVQQAKGTEPIKEAVRKMKVSFIYITQALRVCSQYY